MASTFLDQYETLDVIGNGSFGIIRKVRRKSDGLVFARKELNFERMNERDRKQIVAEVNILKDLGHDHIVRYHDRYVDREAGILYILMEYCGGGDLSTVIKQSTRTNRPIPEDKIWNYFLQILLALNHCHHPNAHTRTGSGSSVLENTGTSNRAQILHRDLKPDNVFLDTADKVKLGDFGLSRALTQTNFANTYVGTPYYMSPELMQEKAYDTKSDIWSLGCVIYELCALKPPFHEAKTHQELSNYIKAGRIPPLPRGYSQTLSSVIKSMLNLNPAMRPSAAQLLQHERISLTLKVTEAEKILTSVKSHRAENTTRERDLNAREAMLREREQQIVALVAQKDSEIANLQRILSVVGEQQNQYSQQYLDAAIKEAVARREDELRILVTKREKEVADAMARREEEIMEAVRRREVEVCEAWTAREAEIKKELADSVRAVDERIEWIQTKEEELKEEEGRLETAQAELNDKLAKWEETITKGRKEKMPLEEIKNFSTRQGDDILHRRKQDNPTPRPTQKTFPALATPVLRPPKLDSMPSAMKGVMLTSTGEILATPTPAELAKLFDNSPKVGLNFAKIFDFEEVDEDGTGQAATSTPTIDREASPPPSPSSRKEKEKVKVKAKATTSTRRRGASSSDAESAAPSPIISSSGVSSDAPPTRLRRPSIRSKSKSQSQMQRSATLPSSVSDPTSLSTASTSQAAVKPLSHPHLSNTATRDRVTVGVNRPQPEYDLADEENLPSPFLKRNLDRGVQSSSSRPPVQLVHQVKKRPSTGHSLRQVAATNAAAKRVSASLTVEDLPTDSSDMLARLALTSARKGSEEARKTLLTRS